MKTGFTKLERGAWGGLLALYSRLMIAIEEDLQTRCNISHVEFEILLRLTYADNNRLRIQELAERSLLSRSGTSRLVERLEKAGLLERAKAKEDKRGAYAILTPEGAEKFRVAHKDHIGLVKDIYLNQYSKEELKTLAGLLQR